MGGRNVARCFMCDEPTAKPSRVFTFNIAHGWTMKERAFGLCQIDAWAMEHEDGFARKAGSKMEKELR